MDEDEDRPPEERKVEIYCNAVARRGASLVPAETLLNQPELASNTRGEWTDEQLQDLAARLPR